MGIAIGLYTLIAKNFRYEQIRSGSIILSPSVMDRQKPGMK